MGGIRLFSGNRLEILAQRLSEELSVPLPDPFEKEIIVVQSRGMEHWLSMQLARHHGVCANIEFPFPAAMVGRLFALVPGHDPDRGVMDEQSMVWEIMEALPRLKSESSFEPVRAYIEDDPSGVRRYQLSTRLAELFDNYIIFRPAMIAAWDRGKGVMPGEHAGIEAWQSRLWREIARGREHAASMRERFLRSLDQVSASELPRRISLFGISYLPPFHLEVFQGLSSLVTVNFFLLNPCRQYWGDIRSGNEIARMTAAAGGRHVGDLFLEEGNSLLAALGGSIRDLFDMLQDLDPEDLDEFRDIEGSSLLERVQADILDLRRPQGDGPVVSDRDGSIRIHSCHSPMREVEVLKDNLLALFDDHPDLRPEEILVMAPAIERYIPFIRAVFDTDPGDRTRIPYRIVDRSLKSSSTLADTLMAIFDLSLSRFEASRVTALLETAEVRDRFGISESDLELIREWVDRSGIRWGIDAEWKESLHLPGTRENTWSFGIERLLLGYAMPSGGRTPFASILGYDDMEGESVTVLGSFVTFLSTVFSRVRQLRESHTLEGWVSVLNSLMDAFFLPGEGAADEERRIRSVIGRLTGGVSHSGRDAVQALQPGSRLESLQVGGEVIRLYLRQAVARIEEGRNFLSGGVTFCEMLPMRSVPFEAVFILGMNHGDFPRMHSPRGFDLIARQPRKGDHNRRNQDLSLFLEAMLSSRRAFSVSYVGQGIRDNSPRPPSVAVSTLMDCLDGYGCADGIRTHDLVTTRHCLQAFNPRYFTGKGRLFSYSAENAGAAGSLAGAAGSTRVFMPGDLPEPDDTWSTVDLADLCSFFRNPCRYLLRKRLGLDLSVKRSFQDDLEPLEPDGLEEFTVRQELVRLDLGGIGASEAFDLLRMGGMIPHGEPGRSFFSEMSSEAGALAGALRRHTGGGAGTTRSVDLTFPRFRITGSLTTWGDDRIVLLRAARIKAGFRFEAWLHHLVLSCLMPGKPCTTTCITLDETFLFSRVDNARALLSAVLDHYARGLVAPLPFFPRTSWVYAGTDGPPEQRMRKAFPEWTGSRTTQGERDDPYIALGFQGRQPLGEEFGQVSLDLFRPLMDHLGKVAP